MVAASAASLNALATAGYVVIRDFLSAEQVSHLQQDYERGVLQPNKNHVQRVMSRGALGSLSESLSWIGAQTAKHTDLRVNTLGEGLFGHPAGIYFATAGNQKFGWHQDHESFYTLQNHYHYLNCYIPVIKPDRRRSNLSVVSFDAMQKRSPELFERTRASGATRVFVKGTKTTVIDDSGRGRHIALAYDIAELAETPELAAGDLLLMRGDVIHQTQDADTRRVAASIRLVDRQTALSLDTLLGFGLMKWNMMRKNPQVYADILGAFRRAGTRSLRIDQVLAPLSRFQGRGGLAALCVELSLAKLRSTSAD